jgi:hypothetical protein
MYNTSEVATFADAVESEIVEDECVDQSNVQESVCSWMQLRSITGSSVNCSDNECTLFHPDSLKPFNHVLHPDNLERFHPIYEETSVSLTKSGSSTVARENLIKLQRIWHNLDKIALSSPRCNGNDWNQAVKRYKPSASMNSAF